MRGALLFAVLCLGLGLGGYYYPHSLSSDRDEAGAASEPSGTQRVPQRIVSLAPNFSEIIDYLGHGTKLVGVTIFCRSIDDAVARVGSFHQPDIERIVELEPDLVLVVESVGQESLVATLREVGLQVVALGGDDIADLRETMTWVGETLGAADRSRAFVERLDTALQPDARTKDAPRALFVVDHEPLYAAGGSSFVNDMLVAAGYVNVCADRSKPWVPLDLEQVVSARADIIFDTTLTTRGPEAKKFWDGVSERLGASFRPQVLPFEQVQCGVQIPDWIATLRSQRPAESAADKSVPR